MGALWHAYSGLGGELRTDSDVQNLLVEEGQVTGVLFSRGGRSVVARARRGVVLATGGFSANSELRKRFAPELDANANHVRLTCESATGDGLEMAVEAGAAVFAELHQPMAWAPSSWVPHKGSSFPHFLERAKPGILMVNGQGRRFANEAMVYHDLVPAMLDANLDIGDNRDFWIMADHKAQRRYGLGAALPRPAMIFDALRSGYLLKGHSIQELAQKMAVSPATLAQTVARFNEFAARGIDVDFQRGTSPLDRAYGDPSNRPNPCLGALLKPPFYAVRVQVGDLGSLVGLRTNAKAQVLDHKGKEIPGLFAVGLDAATAMGGRYPAAGVTVGAALTFGWIAAHHALGFATE